MARYPTTYEVLVLQERVTLHRACSGADPFSVLGGLRSNYENRRDRPHPARIGTHVMSLALQPGYGVCVADTSGPGHWSVWGIPAQLQMFVTEIKKVR